MVRGRGRVRKLCFLGRFTPQIHIFEGAWDPRAAAAPAMSRSSQNRQRTVFVRNVSYEASDEELRALFSSVGPLVRLNTPVDHTTQKRKGFVFVEYLDAETALSAVRNLNDIDFHGRQLSVNIADQDTKNSDAAMSKKRKADSGRGAPSGPWDSGNGVASLPAVGLPPLHNPVAEHIELLGRSELFELVTQTKQFFATQPEEARRLLSSQPQVFSALSLAIDRLAGPQWPPPTKASSPPQAPPPPPQSASPQLPHEPPMAVKMDVEPPMAANQPGEVTVKRELDG